MLYLAHDQCGYSIENTRGKTVRSKIFEAFVSFSIHDKRKEIDKLLARFSYNCQIRKCQFSVARLNNVCLELL